VVVYDKNEDVGGVVRHCTPASLMTLSCSHMTVVLLALSRRQMRLAWSDLSIHVEISHLERALPRRGRDQEISERRRSRE
jgi:hypothetical protein